MSRDNVNWLTRHTWRVIADIEDPLPTKVEARELRDTFDDKCGLCGVPVPRNNRKQLLFADPAGPRAIGNRLLVCELCRRSRRAGESWQALLKRCCEGDAAAYATRAAWIEDWQITYPLPPPMVSPTITAIHARVENALLEIAKACRELRTECRALRSRSLPGLAPAAPDPHSPVGGPLSGGKEGQMDAPPAATTAPPRPESGRARLVEAMDRLRRATPPASSLSAQAGAPIAPTEAKNGGE